MGIRVARQKPRHILASVAYKLDRLLPFSRQRKLDFWLDLASVSHRLANENAGFLGLKTKRSNKFLLNGVKPTDRVVEIGCSTGRVISTVDAAVRVGVDLDATALELGKEKHPDITFIREDARKYLKDSNKFDVLILSHILEHIDDPEDFLTSIRSHFDRIYLEIPDFDWTDLNEIRLMRNRRLMYMDDDHVAEFDREELETIFERLRIEVVDREFRFGLMRYWLKPIH